MPPGQPDDKDVKKSLYLEDFLILASVGLLLWLGVFQRHETWAQWELAGVLVIMLIVFIRRIRRTYRAFKEKEKDS